MTLLQTKISWWVLFFSAVLLHGCATSRGVVSLTPPASDKVGPTNGIKVYIQSVVDKRVFEEEPKNPDIPSLDPSEPQNANIRLRAIARKRNTFGKGLGDILLSEGQTVESVIRDSLGRALVENGYTIVDNPAASSQKHRVVDVQINKFWSWMNPGFWAITLSTEISTDISVRNGNEANKQTIHVKAEDHFQTGIEDNWLSVMNSALKDYKARVKEQFK